MIWFLTTKGAPVVLAWVLQLLIAANGSSQAPASSPIASGAAARVLSMALRVVATLTASEAPVPAATSSNTVLAEGFSPAPVCSPSPAVSTSLAGFPSPAAPASRAASASPVAATSRASSASWAASASWAVFSSPAIRSAPLLCAGFAPGGAVVVAARQLPPPSGGRGSSTAAPQSKPAPAATASPSREGGYWTETVSGVATVPPKGRLSISTRGTITAEGGSDSAVHYVLTKRVRSESAGEARSLLKQYKVETESVGDLTVLRIVHAGEDAQSADLRVSLPRGLRDVTIETHGGAVVARDIDGSLKARTGGGRMDLDRIGGKVTAVTAGGDIALGSIKGSIYCTSAGGSITARSIGGSASLETAGGDITVGEVRALLHASTAGGGIRVEKAGGAVVATTAGGTIDVGRAQGMVTARNLGGPIEVGAAQGVSLETAGGGIRLRNVSGSLRAETAVGNIYVHLARTRPLEDSLLATGAGDIIVYIPADFPLTIRAENASPDGARSIISNFPGMAIRTAGPLAVAEAKVRGGGPLLKLAGSGGKISIMKLEKQDE